MTDIVIFIIFNVIYFNTVLKNENQNVSKTTLDIYIYIIFHPQSNIINSFHEYYFRIILYY